MMQTAMQIRSSQGPPCCTSLRVTTSDSVSWSIILFPFMTLIGLSLWVP